MPSHQTLGYQAVIDACVLVNAALRDTLLRTAEPPRLYLPRWSKDILEEVRRTLENRLGVSPAQTAHLLDQLSLHFPDCCIEGYEALIPAMKNDPKDRHVLAAAVLTGAQTIVTFNVRHFPSSALEPWGVEAQTPDEFLVHQFYFDPGVVVAKLKEQAEAVRKNIDQLLEVHSRTVPTFAALVREFLTP